MNKEQRTEAMINTLKNGLFNGLKASPNCNLYEEVGFADPDFTDEKNLLPSSVWEVSGYAPKQLDNSDEAPSGWVFTLGSTWMSPSVSVMSPHLFPLEYLLKEITVEGYNDNKPFVPYDKLFFGSEEKVHMQGEWFLEQINNGNGHIAVNLLDHYKVLALNKMKFNTEGLEPSEFINAAESGVYTPKSK